MKELDLCREKPTKTFRRKEINKPNGPRDKADDRKSQGSCNKLNWHKDSIVQLA